MSAGTFPPSPDCAPRFLGVVAAAADEKQMEEGGSGGSWGRWLVLLCPQPDLEKEAPRRRGVHHTSH